ncbi:MAG: hypothetical protein NTW15_20635 [Burkholderiales bacterium]|nr:hypothetical protein [Burkholderiales bacterium]
MTPDTLLLRQIHPGFVQNGRVTSQAFRHTPKDEFQLSVDNGARVTAEAAWRRFTADPACTSAGVQAISRSDCAAQVLPVIEDGSSHPEHCSIDFSAFEKKAIDKKAKLLRAAAATRGWLFTEAAA